MIRVLIADDNSASRETLKRRLEEEPNILVVAEATEGESAVALARALLPDVMLIDLVMPRLDGLAVAEAIEHMGLERMPHMALLVMDSQRDALLRIGTQNLPILRKPVEVPEAMEMINSFAITPRSVLDGPSGTRIEGAIFAMLNELGVPGHLSGSAYLKHAIALTVADYKVLEHMNQQLYPVVANEYKTTPRRVERAMRFAVESAWNRGRVDRIEKIFGYTIKGDIGRPTNAEFIAMVAESVRMQMRGACG